MGRRAVALTTWEAFDLVVTRKKMTGTLNLLKLRVFTLDDSKTAHQIPLTSPQEDVIFSRKFLLISVTYSINAQYFVHFAFDRPLTS